MIKILIFFLVTMSGIQIVPQEISMESLLPYQIVSTRGNALQLTIQIYNETTQELSSFEEFELEVSKILDKYGVNASDSEIQLLVGTAAVETDLGKNIDHRGIFQIEKNTAKWMEEVISKKYPEHFDALCSAKNQKRDLKHNIKLNFDYQVILAYGIYKVRGIDNYSLNSTRDYAKAWKKLWNTEAGKGSPKHFVNKWNLHSEKIS